MTERTPKLIGIATVVNTTSKTVATVKRPILTSLCPTFRKTPVVTASARNTRALSVSVARNSGVLAGQRLPCQFRNSIQVVRKGNGRAVRDARSQSCRTTRRTTLAIIHKEKGR